MERITKAMHIIAAHASTLGIIPIFPRLLRDSNHVTMQINDDLVARIRLNAEKEVFERMRREIEVCRFLADAGAPVTQPTTRFNPGPYEFHDTLVSYWICEQVLPDVAPDLKAIVRSFKRFHTALFSYPGFLPDFRESVSQAYSLLMAHDRQMALVPADHRFLDHTYQKLQTILASYSYQSQPLHGDCHLGNVFAASRGYLWTDFESVCQGPIEWDLACLPEEVLSFSTFDRALFKVLSALRSWCVAVWCWAAYDRSAEKREAAHYHTNRLRTIASGPLTPFL